MNKEQLTEKYFWEQKRKEVITIVSILVGALILIYLIGIISLKINPEGLNVGSKEEPNYSTNVFAVGFFWSIILFVLGLILFMFGYMFRLMFKTWIEANWQKAKLRVEEAMAAKKLEK